jgi:hypothetical protein
MFEPKIVTRQIVIDLSAGSLTNETIPEQNRVFPDWCCRLTHKSSRLQVPGQFTGAEAKLIPIPAVTQDRNFSIDKDCQPCCAARLLQLLAQICAPTSSDQEVAA